MENVMLDFDSKLKAKETEITVLKEMVKSDQI